MQDTIPSFTGRVDVKKDDDFDAEILSLVIGPKALYFHLKAIDREPPKKRWSMKGNVPLIEGVYQSDKIKMVYEGDIELDTTLRFDTVEVADTYCQIKLILVQEDDEDLIYQLSGELTRIVEINHGT